MKIPQIPKLYQTIMKFRHVFIKKIAKMSNSEPLRRRVTTKQKSEEESVSSRGTEPALSAACFRDKPSVMGEKITEPIVIDFRELTTSYRIGARISAHDMSPV